MKISSKIAGLGATLALALSGPAFAGAHGAGSSPSYDYLGISYAILDTGLLANDSLDGFRVEGSVGLTDNIHLVGDWIDVSGRLDPGAPKADLDQYRVALGYNHALTNTTDFVVRAGWIRQRAKGSFDGSNLGSISENGYTLEALTRMMINDQFELNFGGQYSDVSGDIGDRVTFNSGFVYTFAQGVAVRSGVELGADTAQVDLGVRWNFGGFRR